MNTYDLGVVVFETAHDEVHVLVEAAFTGGYDVHLKVLILRQCCTLEIKSAVVMIDNLEQASVIVWRLFLNLRIKWQVHVKFAVSELVACSHDHY